MVLCAAGATVTLHLVTQRGARKQRQGSLPPLAGAAYQLNIALRDVRPEVWRRIVVPADVTLDVLHRAVQAAMGWDDAHLHVWDIAGAEYGVPDPDWDVVPESEVAVADVCSEGARLQYTYDLGDDWEHDITVERLLSPDEAGEVPRCDAGAGACPPEDIGGVPGYSELVDALSGRRPGASDRGRELADVFDGFDRERFDPRQATRRLRAAVRT